LLRRSGVVFGQFRILGEQPTKVALSKQDRLNEKSMTRQSAASFISLSVGGPINRTKVHF
jgi:hypothetical protein